LRELEDDDDNHRKIIDREGKIQKERKKIR